MEGRILLVHALFEVLGGAEFVALSAARALRESGYDVSIATCTPINANMVRDIFNIDTSSFNIVVKRISVVNLLKRVSGVRLVRLRKLIAYKEIFTEYVRKVGDSYDLVMETQSSTISPADISYIHYPTLADPQRSGLHWRLYNWLVKLYGGMLGSKASGRVLTNSAWTAAQIYMVYHVVADVVYPPVDVEYFSKVAGNDRREKIVVTISRFSAEKRLWRIVDAAARLRDYTFILIGSTDEYSSIVLNEIERRVREYHLDNVVVEPNLPRSKVLGFFRDARYYLHPEFPEHFGIAVAEAIAAGLVPLVYRDGGAWYDIASRISDMLGYDTIEKAPEIIRRIDSEPELYEKLRRKSIEVSRMFSYENFKQALINNVEHVLRVKRIASGYHSY